MKKNQEARLGMYNAVIAYIEENPGIVQTVPAFQITLNAFKDKVGEIIAMAQLEAQVIGGAAIQKNELRLALCRQTADFAAAAYAYAVNTRNVAMQEKTKFSYSVLRRYKDGMLAPVCRNIIEAISPIPDTMSDYGITTQSVQDLVTAIDNYVVTISSPRNAISKRVSYRTALTSLFKEANDLLKKQLDKVALQFKASQPAFYTTYRNNRGIVDAGQSTTQIKGLVTTMATDTPVSGASVELLGESFTTTANTHGIFTIKTFRPGTFAIKVSKKGFLEKTIEEVVVKLGQSASVNVQLEAA